MVRVGRDFTLKTIGCGEGRNGAIIQPSGNGFGSLDGIFHPGGIVRTFSILCFGGTFLGLPVVQVGSAAITWCEESVCDTVAGIRYCF